MFKNIVFAANLAGPQTLFVYIIERDNSEWQKGRGRTVYRITL